MKATLPVTEAASSHTSASATRDMLHLTNGTSIVPKIRAAGIEGRIVAWDDVLHEGPVPAGLGIAALRSVRVDFLASCGWGPRDAIARDLESCDAALDKAATASQEIVLWFEHDLYDQLHLLQILERLPVDGGPQVTMVPAATYLGQQPASDYPELFERRRVVGSSERMTARDAWQAFRSPDPRTILAALPRLTELPHLAAAMHRHLQQFPSVRNGLSRTERQTLEAIAEGVTGLKDVFVSATQDREEAMFTGDAAFLFHISSLFRAGRPLLKTHGTLPPTALPPSTLTPSALEPWNASTLELSVELTPDGARVLRGELDRVQLCGIDRWLGGVHLAGPGPVWRWDGERRELRFV
jgi:hypothetical protein